MSDTQNYEYQQDSGGTGSTQVDSTPAPQSENDRLLDNFMRDTDGQRTQREGTDSRQTPGDQGNTQGTQRGAQPPPSRTGQSPNQQTQQGGEGARGTAPVQHVPQATRTYGNMFLADGNGDIYDAQGRLIAKQGYGRSIFHKLYPYIETAATENAALRSKVENYESANSVARQNGLTMEDVGASMHLMVQWKKDPVGTIRTLLQVARERGNDVSSLGGGGGGLDPSALRATVADLLKEHLAPFQPMVEQQQQAREQFEREQAVTQQYNEFITTFPDAIPHQVSIANVMRDHGMSEREAYFALRAYAASNGLDWNQDLKAQLEARTGQQQPPAGNGRQLPNLNGGRGNGAAAPTGRAAETDPNESWSSIISRTFKQHGIELP